MSRDESLRNLFENYENIEKVWLKEFCIYVKSLKIEDDCPYLTPEFILEKLQKEQNVLGLPVLSLSNLLKLPPLCADKKQTGNSLSEFKKRSLIICKLVSSRFPVGSLCIMDKEQNAVLCSVTEQHGESISSINEWCALMSWNNVIGSYSGEKNVEVTGQIIPLQKANDETCTALMSADAKFVLENKEISKKSEVINICGQIIAVNEIFRVKKDTLFCVRLESDVNILIKKKEFLPWQIFLLPKKEYLFTNMKPTTLQQGAGHPVRLFVPCKNSIVYCCTPERSNILSLEDWMSKAGITEVSVDYKDYRATDEIVKNNHISYQGVITSDEYAYLGVFELDQKVRLYLSYIPVTYVSLRLGTKIMVYNAHLQKSEKDDKIRIVGCLSSCIKILEFSSTNLSAENLRIPKSVQINLWKQKYSLNGLTFVMDVMLHLRQKFTNYTIERFGEILPVITDLCSVNTTLTRNHLQEVLTTTCCFLSDKTEYKHTFPQVIEIDIPDAEDKMNDIAVAKHDGNKGWNRTLYWNYVIQQGAGHQIIVGEIHISSRSSKIQLRDQTGVIECVVMETQKDHEQYHECTAQCCMCYQTPRSRFTCPHLHPHHSGCLVAITKFTVVKERFLLGNFTDIRTKDNIVTSKTKELIIKYLVFSLLDVILIQKPKYTISCQHSSLQNSSKDKENHKMDVSDNHRLYVNQKESLNMNDNNKNKVELSFIAHICDHLHQRKDMYEEKCLTSQTLIDIEKDVNAEEKQQSCSKCQLVLFENSNVKYFNVIQSGCLYRFVGFDGVIKERRKLPWQLKQSAKKAGDNLCYVLPDNFIVEREFHEQKSDAAKQLEGRVDSIEHILTRSYCRHYVSILGTIVRRVHHEPDDIGIVLKRLKFNRHLMPDNGISTLDNWQIQLQIKCMKSEREISVYLKLDNVTYPLGLVPGTVVYMEQIERRVSRKGVVYCQFSIVSSITALHQNWSELITRKEENPEECDDSQLPTEQYKLGFLADVWEDNSIQQFSCVCFVQKVVKISLKCSCQMCGSVIVDRCTNNLCHCEEYTFVSRMSLIIDDGTSVAMVTCSDKKVQTLLLLSEDQWEALKLSVKQHGEVFLQQSFPDFGSTLEKFVYVLCENSVIKRTVHMCLTCKPISCNGKEPYLHPCDLLNSMGLEDFTEKTIDTGISTIKTRCLPFIQLNCQKVTEMDYLKHTLSSFVDL
ncbi:CST complex subunit CTC1-like [Mytilus californianus]|uniref:CST complex subunit CTC1-like n=1 Tax=Mytilus californianus TaxID=6549 RepID=UPI002245DF2F|nr:CST complex subunit CTC1-like [Mytilus californianus]